MNSQTAERDKYTGRWQNLNPCFPCLNALRRPGKHRAHRCDGETLTGTVAIICDCSCQRLSTGMLEYLATHSMALDWPKP